jgi:chromosome partitioning protein
MPTVAVLNQKGGVGKTTLTLGLAAAAQRAGDPVLVVDLDPQGSAGWAMGVEADDDHLAVGDVLRTGDPKVARASIVTSGWGEGIDVLPASRNLIDREADGRHPDAVARLRRALAPVVGSYRVVLIDCAPSLGPTTVAGMTAADGVLLVIELSALSLRGVEAVVDTIEQVGRDHHPELDLLGAVVNRAPAVSTEADRQVHELERALGRATLWRPFIPQRTVVNEAVGHRCPVQDLGYRARDVIDVFDELYAHLVRVLSEPPGEWRADDAEPPAPEPAPGG